MYEVSYGKESAMGIPRGEHFWQREQQLESQKMGMNLTSSRHRKEASVSGVEWMKGRLGSQGVIEKETRELDVGRGPDLIGPYKDFGFYSKCSEKSTW